MNDNDKQRFLSCLLGAAEIIGKDLSKQAMKLYWEILKKYSIEEVEQAFFSHASNPDVGQFMPKPADIIKAIDGSGESRSMTAWTKVDKALRTIGTYETVVFDDPIIHKVISDMGGWVGFGEILENEYPFKANEFNKRYLGYANRQNIKHPKKLIGLFEITNIENKQKVAPPVLLGNPGKAKLVLEGGGGDKMQITRGFEIPKLTVEG